MTYPCQQAAFSTASLAFGAPVVGALVKVRRRAAAALCTPLGVAVAMITLLTTAGLWSGLTRADLSSRAVLEPPGDYRAEVFHVSDCPQDPMGDRFVGIDNLFSLMGQRGLKFYRSNTVGLISGPEGIIASDDVVVVKINYQWGDRGGSNVDVLRGLIHRIVDHPDGFVGEVVVCENAQFVSIDFDRDNNNAQDHGMSPHDVVAYFQGLGHAVSHYNWTLRRTTLVDEYSDGDMTDGYVVYPHDSGISGCVSYPKFRTDYGTYISLRDGVWDSNSATYDRESLKYINLPVLKSHGAVYGVTACVKNYVGTASTALSTNTHNATRYGLLGALLAEIGPADLNILDCIWINGDPERGPSTSYVAATRRDMLVASTDPVAADMYAATKILIPTFLENGHPPPWTNPNPDPADPDSDFRQYLDNSMSELLAAGYEVTNDLSQIDAFTWNGAGDFDGDSDLDLEDFNQFDWCETGPGGGPLDSVCASGDFDADDDIDLIDLGRLQVSFTGAL
jgi:hypothetical protein